MTNPSWSEDIARILGPTMMVEALLLLGILLSALLAPTAGQAFALRIEAQAKTRLASPGKQIVAVGLLALLARALFLPWLGPAVPLVHDEHSLLLQAQTFLSGRLVNPTPAFWQHFETIHLNVVPTYASMYFPGRSLPLLLGELLAGEPWIGVWLSFIAMGMAAVWMLRAWVPAPYALLGGILVVLRLGVFSYWVNSYWSGAFIAFAAMLVIGAIPRFLEHRSWSSSILLALGAGLLLLTRPVEGAMLCLPVAVYLLWRIWRSAEKPMPGSLLRLGIPAALLLALSGGTLLSYNRASTGDALTTPYDLNRQMYALTPAFLFSERPQSQQRGPAFFREFYQWEDSYFVGRHKPAKAIRSALSKVYYNGNFYVGLILLPAFLAGLWAARRQWFLLSTLGFFMAAYMFWTWNFPHYTAPIFPVILIITMMGFVRLRTWQPKGRPLGVALTRAMPAATLLVLAVPAGNVVFGWPKIDKLHSRSALLPCCALRTSSPRTDLIARLRSLPGRDIVLVSPSGHPPHAPMVYNEPDIANSEIIWANSLDPKSDGALLRHHSGRRVWLLQWADGGDPVYGSPLLTELRPPLPSG